MSEPATNNDIGKPAYQCPHCDPQRQDPNDDPRREEEGCYGVTGEKKYYKFQGDKDLDGSVHIKRNITPSEYWCGEKGRVFVPFRVLERVKNEANTIKYIKKNTSIPVPNIRCAFEDHGRFYVITDIVPGFMLSKIPEDKKPIVIEELQGYIDQMHALKSKTMGSVLGDSIVILPYRIGDKFCYDPTYNAREAAEPEFVLCHNDLSQFNILVDETTFKITAIIDWEYSGFFPPEFDGPYYTRPGPSCAIGDEEDDTAKLFTILEKWKA